MSYSQFQTRSACEEAKDRLSNKIQHLKTLINHRERRKDILFTFIENIVTNYPVSEKYDSEIRAMLELITDLINEIDSMHDQIEHYYETVYQYLRLFDMKYHPK